MNRHAAVGIILPLALCAVLWSGGFRPSASAQVPAAGQWVTVEVGDMVDLAFDSALRITRYNKDFFEMPAWPGVINNLGQCASSKNFKTSSYNIDVMAIWHPVTSMFYAYKVEGGYVVPGGIIDIDSPNLLYQQLSVALALNDNGWAVGWSVWYSNQVPLKQPVFWDGLRVKLMSSLDDYNRMGTAISNNGWMAGYNYLSGSDNFRAFRRNGALGSPQTLSVMNSINSTSIAYAINDQGMAAGSDTYMSVHGVIWGDGGGIQTDISAASGRQAQCYDINEAGHVVGEYYTGVPISSRPFLWRNSAEGMVSINSLSSPGENAAAVSLNEHDQVTGWSYTEPFDDSGDGAVNPIHAFYCDGSSAAVEDLGAMGLSHSWGYKITDTGVIYGFVGEDTIIWDEFLVRWEKEAAIDGNADGTDDNEQEHVVSFTACTGAPLTLIAPAGLSLSQVWSHHQITRDGSFYFVTPDYLIFDSPAGYTHFRLDGVEPGGEIIVEMKLREPVPFAIQDFYINPVPNVNDDHAVAVFTAGIGDRAELAVVEGKVVVTLRLTDGGVADIDSAPDGAIEFFGGPVGVSLHRIIDYTLGREAPFVKGSVQEQAADINGDEAINVGDLNMGLNLFGPSAINPPFIPVYIFHPGLGSP